MIDANGCEKICRRLLDDSPSLIWRCDVQGRCFYFNRAWLDFTGRAMEQEAGDGWAEGVFPADLDRCLKTFCSALADRIPFEMEYRLRHRDGYYRWIVDYGRPLFGNGETFIGFIGTCYDISARKHAEDALVRLNEHLEQTVALRTTELSHSRNQLRSLSAHLESARENERSSIAREIHDELGQLLSALKMDFSWLRKRLPADDTAVHSHADIMNDLIDQTINSVQRIATELRPMLLDELGLSAAIEWQAAEFQRRTGIGCSLTTSLADSTLDRGLSTAIFRIFQETLTNIMRHAAASHVRVVLTSRRETVLLQVRDNGCGIAREAIDNAKSLGLVGMRERTLLWGGRLAIRSRNKKGTVIRVTFPLRKEE